MAIGQDATMLDISDIDQSRIAAQRKQDLELDEQYPHRPHNHAKTLPFHTLHTDLFAPLLENKGNRPATATLSRRQIGPRNAASQSPHEIRRAIIDRYISRWRKEVGKDFYPAFRLILPDKDRDRAMYGLKEKVIAKYIVKILKIDKNSEDAFNLLNWKQPTRGGISAGIGDFPGRIYEVFSKRPFRTEFGTLTIEEVNDLLDRLSQDSKEEHQIPIFETFYRNMNPDELKWLICIILRSMHVGATEKTFLHIWHPDAEALFNVSSSLRKVCWELWSKEIRLEGSDRGVNLFECFQPQLAAFQPRVMKTVASKMRTTEDDPVFWIEEKLDGERMQMHMEKQTDGQGQIIHSFKFWSRKAKDYTYLYGESLTDDNSALTRHLKAAFDEKVDSIILDGEMITWDMDTDKIVPFGTLKTAAIEQQRNPYATGPRPLFKVFDILLLNGKPLTAYTLRDRRKALQAVVRPVERRLELLSYREGQSWDDIEVCLRKVVAEASEGLVVKNPRSAYTLNDRNDDWIKVKPEYMQEFGESLDCTVIGGYFGSGKRGGTIGSFLCGLRVDNKVKDETKPAKHLSFFKVGGGLTANDFANIRHHTENKWIPWDRSNPPNEWIELGGGPLQRERPDVWIKPPDSVVVQVKAASVGVTDEFAANLTLRFPRFQKLRSDKDWKTALSLQEFLEVRDQAEHQKDENTKAAREEKMQAETRKRHQRVDLRKQPLKVVGYTQKSINQAVAETKGANATENLFQGQTFYIMTGSEKPVKKTKIQLEELVKAHGGRLVQTVENKTDGELLPDLTVMCIASRPVVKVASLVKKGQVTILRPTWIFDCIRQAGTDVDHGHRQWLLKPELERHVFFCPDKDIHTYSDQVDQFGDSYGRDTTVDELKAVMKTVHLDQVPNINNDLREAVDDSVGRIFHGVHAYLHDVCSDNLGQVAGLELNMLQSRARSISRLLRYGGAKIDSDMIPGITTHIVIQADDPTSLADLSELRQSMASWPRIAHLVTTRWVTESWRERTRLDEERFRAE